MAYTFKYTKITGQYYLSYSDELEYDGVDFEYEVEDDKLLPVLVDIIYADYFDSFGERLKESIANFIKDADLIDTIADYYQDALKEYFESDAMDYYKENYKGDLL